MTGLPPPALSTMPQFTAEHWDKVPRDMLKSKLTAIIKLDDEHTEFRFENGNAFQRANRELDPEMFSKLHANQQVFVQAIQGELVTGLFIPSTGWVFKMSSQDLADYARRTVTAVQRGRNRAKERLADFLSGALLGWFEETLTAYAVPDKPHVIEVSGFVDTRKLASDLIELMETAQPRG